MTTPSKIPSKSYYRVVRATPTGLHYATDIEAHAVQVGENYPALIFVEITGFETDGTVKTRVSCIINGFTDLVNLGDVRYVN